MVVLLLLMLLLSAHGCRAATLEQVDAPRSVELRGNDGGGDQMTFRVDGTERGSEDYGLVELAQSGPREHIHTFMKAVEDGADPGQIDDMGYTSLHWAAVNGHARIAKYIITKTNADVDATNDRGLTPLFLAAQNGQTKVVEMLLAHHADPRGGHDDDADAKVTMGPLDVAIANGHQPVIDLFREHLNAAEFMEMSMHGPMHDYHGAGHTAEGGEPRDDSSRPPADYHTCTRRYQPMSGQEASGLVHSLCTWWEQDPDEGSVLCQQIKAPSQCQRFVDDDFLLDPLLAQFTALCDDRTCLHPDPDRLIASASHSAPSVHEEL